MYFPVIPDNSHDLLRSWHQSFWCFLRNNFLTSRITFHLLHVIDHARWILLLNKRRKSKKTEKNTQNTFIVVVSVLKFVLGNIQRECLSTHYKNHWEFSIGLPCLIWLIGHWLFFCYSKYCIWLKISTYSYALRRHSLRSYGIYRGYTQDKFANFFQYASRPKDLPFHVQKSWYF